MLGHSFIQIPVEDSGLGNRQPILGIYLSDGGQLFRAQDDAAIGNQRAARDAGGGPASDYTDSMTRSPSEYLGDFFRIPRRHHCTGYARFQEIRTIS
jgi:hypothetical protein